VGSMFRTEWKGGTEAAPLGPVQQATAVRPALRERGRPEAVAP